MKEMKILIIANSGGGLIHFRKELITALRDRGFCVYASLPDGEWTEELEELGCKCILTRFDRQGKNPFGDLRLLRNYLRILREISPDMVFTYTIKPNVYGGIACAMSHIPYVANITGLGTAVENGGLMQKLTTMLYRRGLRKAQRVFFQNRANWEFMQERLVLKKGTPSSLIPGSGVNLSIHKFEPYPKSPQFHDRILFVGRVMKDKGVEELFDAAIRIKEEYPDVTFDVVGGMEENYSSRMKELEEKNIVKYWGRQKDVHPFFSGCSAVVLPSYHEGMSNTLLEGASTGRPLLASNVPGCRETFDEGVTGLGFAAKNADELYQTLKKFICLPYSEKAAMGRASREKMEAEFDRKIVVEAYMKEIERIM